jgi:hypothetical protein
MLFKLCYYFALLFLDAVFSALKILELAADAASLPCRYHDSFSFVTYHLHFLMILTPEINFFMPLTPF